MSVAQPMSVPLKRELSIKLNYTEDLMYVDLNT